MPTARAASKAPPTQESRLVRLLLISVVALPALWLGTESISDQSAFLHLSIARQLLHGGFSAPDPWVIAAAHEYVATEWLPAFAAYGVESVAGLRGVEALFCATILVCLALTFFAARRIADMVPSLLVTGAFFVAANHALTPRPQLLGVILLSISVAAWWRTAEDLTPRWWLVPVTWVFACSHGLWLVAVGVGVLTSVGLVADHKLGWQQASRLFAVPVASLGAAALTPLGPALLLTPFTVSGRVRDFVGEWQATSAHDLAAMVTLAMLCLVLLGLARSRTVLPWWQVFHLVLAFALTLAMQRTIAVGAVLAVPLLAQTLQRWRGTTLTTFPPRSQLALAGGVLMLAFLAVPLTATSAAKPAALPAALSAHLASLPTGTTVLEDTNMSAWVRWTQPRLRTVLDSRSEIFSAPQHLDYSRLMAVAPGWQKLLEQTKATYALVLTDSPIAAALQDELHWRAVGSNGGWTFLSRP